MKCIKTMLYGMMMNCCSFYGQEYFLDVRKRRANSLQWLQRRASCFRDCVSVISQMLSEMLQRN